MPNSLHVPGRPELHFARFTYQAGDNAMIGVVDDSFDCKEGIAAADTAYGWGYFLEDGEGKHNGKWVPGPS